jgi:hypothetical protein
MGKAHKWVRDVLKMKDQSRVPPCPRAQGFIWSYLGGNCLVATKGFLKKPRGEEMTAKQFLQKF